MRHNAPREITEDILVNMVTAVETAGPNQPASVAYAKYRIQTVEDRRNKPMAEQTKVAKTKPTTNKRKNDKKETDKSAPKRARNAYNFFTTTMRPKLTSRAKEEGIHINTLLGLAWKHLTVGERLPFKTLETNAKERSDQETKRYRLNTATDARSSPLLPLLPACPARTSTDTTFSALPPPPAAHPAPTLKAGPNNDGLAAGTDEGFISWEDELVC